MRSRSGAGIARSLRAGRAWLPHEQETLEHSGARWRDTGPGDQEDDRPFLRAGRAEFAEGETSVAATPCRRVCWMEGASQRGDRAPRLQREAATARADRPFLRAVRAEFVE